MGKPTIMNQSAAFGICNPSWITDPWSYMPGRIDSPGTHDQTSMSDVISGSVGDSVLVSDAAHVICHALCT